VAKGSRQTGTVTSGQGLALEVRLLVNLPGFVPHGAGWGLWDLRVCGGNSVCVRNPRALAGERVGPKEGTQRGVCWQRRANRITAALSDQSRTDANGGNPTV